MRQGRNKTKRFKLTLNVVAANGATAQTTANLSFDASATDIRTALDPILNPNGSILDPFNPRNDNSKPYTNNVAVSRIGNVYTITFQGEHRTKSVVSVNAANLLNTAGVAGIDVATLKDQGIDVELFNWRGVFGAPGISDAQKKALLAALDVTVKSAGWKEALAKQDWTDIYMPGDAFNKYIDDENKRISDILGELALKK